MKKLNREEQEALLEHLGTIYRKQTMNVVSLALQVCEEETMYMRHELHVEVNCVLKSLPCEYAEIIKNDFLQPMGKKWWKQYYTKKHYEYVKNIAMCIFFHCLYP